MRDSLAKLWDTSDFPARWSCGQWSQPHGWLHVISDVAIFAAYAMIPVLLIFFARRRRDVPFLPIFWLFAAFIFTCGSGHLIEATIFWHPWYRLSGAVKVLTALVSWATVLALIPAIPRALSLPGLAAVSARLRAEAEERTAIAERLREHARDLEQRNEDLRRLSDIVVDREERVLALKQEVNALLRELKRPERYLQSEA